MMINLKKEVHNKSTKHFQIFLPLFLSYPFETFIGGQWKWKNTSRVWFICFFRICITETSVIIKKQTNQPNAAWFNYLISLTIFQSTLEQLPGPYQRLKIWGGHSLLPPSLPVEIGLNDLSKYGGTTVQHAWVLHY